LPRLDVPARADKVTLVLELAGAPGAGTGGRDADVDRLWGAIGSKTRNQVRKAEKAGLTIERRGRDGMRDFYRVWRVNMRDLGSPAHSERWFEALADHLAERAACYLVRRGREVIGGLVALSFRDTVLVPWASSDRRYFHLCPNNLLYWTAIRDAALAGARRFDFGRSSVGSGTYHFKRQWGAAEVRLYWQEVDALAPPALLAAGVEPPAAASPVAGHGRQRAERLWRVLPVPLATWLGSRIRGGITL
jgi:CelD/BcsL family acetyltransferase involved in cellulose biosynthesis